MARILIEYGDPFDVMGGGWGGIGFYNADHAIALGWLAPNVNYANVETSGSYSIEWYGSRPAGLKALRIRRNMAVTDQWLTVEYRRDYGRYDTTFHPYTQVFDGALIHLAPDIGPWPRDTCGPGGYCGWWSALLDFTPNSSSNPTQDFSDPVLAVGEVRGCVREDLMYLLVERNQLG